MSITVTNTSERERIDVQSAAGKLQLPKQFPPCGAEDGLREEKQRRYRGEEEGERKSAGL